MTTAVEQGLTLYNSNIAAKPTDIHDLQSLTHHVTRDEATESVSQADSILLKNGVAHRGMDMRRSLLDFEDSSDEDPRERELCYSDATFRQARIKKPAGFDAYLNRNTRPQSMQINVSGGDEPRF